jgi:hypothetical protein
MVHQIYLIPGFFGFANIGEVMYFAHVREHLQRCLARGGHQAAIHYVPTLPTASLRLRAARLFQVIAGTATDERDPIHLVGHSTGGLDARVLASPGVDLLSSSDIEPHARRIRSIVTVATPHHGTPLAAFFTGLLGQKLLRALSITTLHSIRLGSIPLPALLALASALPALRLFERQSATILDQVYRQVLRDFSPERQQEIEAFFSQVASDQTLLLQLTPEAADLLNAMSVKRPGIRYGCVVTRARPPDLRGNFSLALQPVQQSMYAIYRALYRITGSGSRSAFPALSASQSRALRRAYGNMPDASANDAIVPTLSQVWGEVVHAVWADHHDVIGHFADPFHRPPHVDWLGTMTRFARPAFEALWTDVASYLVDDRDPPGQAADREPAP